MAKKVRSWKNAIDKSKEGSGGVLRKIWSWLQRFVGPDEPLLWGLRKAEGVVVHHPANMSDERARAAWFDYLRGRRRHHWLWLVVALILCGLSAVLMILPGPNVIGYWFVYRAGCHALALIGVRRACRREVVTSLEPTGVLDVTLSGADRGAIVRLAERCGLRELDVFLVRIGAGPGVGGAGPTNPERNPGRDREEAPAGGRGE